MTSSSPTYHSEMPPWKIELIQRKKKVLNIKSGGNSANNHMTQYGLHHNADNSNGLSNSNSSTSICTSSNNSISSYNQTTLMSTYSTSTTITADYSFNTSLQKPSQHHSITSTPIHSAIGQMDGSNNSGSTMNSTVLSDDCNSAMTTTNTSPSNASNVMSSVQQQQIVAASLPLPTLSSLSLSSSSSSSVMPIVCNTGHSHLQQCISAADGTAALNAANTNTFINNYKSQSETSLLSDSSVVVQQAYEQQQQQQQQQETPFHQLHSRHGSEHIATSTQHDQDHRFNFSANSYFSDQQKQQEKQLNLSPTKCALNKSVPNQITNTSIKTNLVLNKYLKKSAFNNNNCSISDESSVHGSITSSSNSSNNSNWFPSKRNSLNLLVTTSGANSSNKMVAMQELSTGETDNFNTFDDTSEELQYGPGIVSKLRCRYLSLALRQSVSKQRPSLDNLRRATSLNNLLDEEDDEDLDEVDEDEHHNNLNGYGNYDETDKNAWHINGDQSIKFNGDNHTKLINAPDSFEYGTNGNKFDYNQQKNNNRFNTNNGLNLNRENTQKPPIGPTPFIIKSQENRCRQTQRGNDSLKRARSVEALMRYDTLAWRRDMLKDSEEYPSSNPIILDELIVSESTMIKAKTSDQITIEDKIQQARERIDIKPPKRLTSFMDETERPPPDLVKQTLLKFEATANRRPRGNLTRYGNGDVAAKVATYKTKISQQPLPPTVMFPKPAVTSPLLSPSKKPIIKPRTTSPKPIILNGTKINQNQTVMSNGNSNGNLTNTSTTINNHVNSKPSVDINLIKNNLERANLKNGTTVNTNGNGLNRSSPTPSSIRIDTTSYRNNKLDSPLSPESPQSRLTIALSRSSPVIGLESPRINAFEKKSHLDGTPVVINNSPTIAQLTRKAENLLISTPKARPYVADPAVYSDDGDVVEFDSDTESHDGDSSNGGNGNGCSGSYDVNISDNNDSDTGDKFLLNKKCVRKSAIENISNAGTTTKFQFDSNPSLPSTKNSKSYLPVINVANSNSNGIGATVTVRKLSNGDGSTPLPEPSVRQIGIIRPLIAEPKLAPIASVRSMLSPQNQNGKKDSQDMIVVDPLKVTSPTHAINSIVANSDTEDDVVIIECGTKPMPPLRTDNLLIKNLLSSNVAVPHNITSTSALSPILPTMTTNNTSVSVSNNSMVHHKNLINKEKSEDLNISSNSVIIQSPVKWNIKKSLVSSSPMLTTPSTSPQLLLNQSQSSTAMQSLPLQPSPATSAQSKSWQTDVQTNTMVFNFSNRKDVPDYIENDGLVIRRKRELPKPGESGFVLLGDLTVETSTDPEPEDSWTLGDPPSPCDVLFQNDNVIINGRSNIKNKSRDQKQLSIQFHEMLTSTFEYPSESSFSEEINMTNGDDFGNDSDLMHNGSFLGSTPIGSVPLGNYTPIKATTFNTNFELGVTRAQTSSPNLVTAQSEQQQTINYNNTINSIKYHQQNDLTKTGFSDMNGSNSNGITNKINGMTTKMTTTIAHTNILSGTQVISVGGVNTNGQLLQTNNGGDVDSLQYLKPASDDQTVAWSEGASDLLF